MPFAIAALCASVRVCPGEVGSGGVCVPGGPCGCIPVSSAAVLLKLGAGEIPPAHLGQSVCGQQSVISHLPQPGVPAN